MKNKILIIIVLSLVIFFLLGNVLAQENDKEQKTFIEIISDFFKSVIRITGFAIEENISEIQTNQTQENQSEINQTIDIQTSVISEDNTSLETPLNETVEEGLSLPNETSTPAPEPPKVNETKEPGAGPTSIENETAKENKTIKEKEIILQAGTNCKEFSENILWTSKYTNKQKGFTNYEIWHPKYNCSAIKENECLIGNIRTNTRFLSTDYQELSNKGSYVRISEPNENACNNPKKTVYQNYLAQETLNGEEKKLNKYLSNFGYLNYENCYTIELHASQYMLVDVFSINYDLCSQKEVINGN